MAAEAVVTFGSGALTAAVSPLGAELQRLSTGGGDELLWNGDPAVWSGRAPILFPIVGALRNGRYEVRGRTYALPKHGFARRSTFQVAEAGEASAMLRLEADDATRAVYPFEFRLEIAFSIAGATLSVEASVANTGGEDMPASLGFHPAFRWPLPFGAARGAHALEFDREEPAPIRRIDRDGLLEPRPRPSPVEGRRLTLRDGLFEDDAVIFDDLASRRVVYGAPGGPRLAVEFEGFPVLGVWSKPGAPFVCVEPWAGLPDPEGFDGALSDKPGAFTVAPGNIWRRTMRVSLLPADAA